MRRVTGTLSFKYLPKMLLRTSLRTQAESAVQQSRQRGVWSGRHLELGVAAQDGAAQLLQALRLLRGRGHHDELKRVCQRVQNARQALQLLHRKLGPACAASAPITHPCQRRLEHCLAL